MNHHLALYYQHPASLWERCAMLIECYAKEGWAWHYIADDHACQTVQSELRRCHPRLPMGEVVPSTAYHFLASPVQIQSIRAALEQAAGATNAAGLVLFIEMTWAIRTPSGAVYLREFEAAADALCKTLPVCIVCLYNEQVMLDAQLLLGLHAHRALIARDAFYLNPHFVPAEIFAARDERAQFQHWLESISPTLRDDPPARASEAAPLPAIYNFPTPELVTAPSSERRWKIRLFGNLRVYREQGALVNWHVPKGATRKTKTLFAYLLHRGSKGATGEELADLLWPQSENPQHGLNRLYHVVNSLRQVLSPDLPANRASPFLIHQDQRYLLAVPEDTWVDYPMFEEMCYRGAELTKQGRDEQALLCFESAARLYTGDFLADIPSEYAENSERDWCWSRRYWFREMYVKVLSQMSLLYRRRKQLSEALQYADQALAVDPCSDLATQEKMLALYEGCRPDALDRQFRLYTQALKQFDMGAPSPVVQTLYQSLRTKFSLAK